MSEIIDYTGRELERLIERAGFIYHEEYSNLFSHTPRLSGDPRFAIFGRHYRRYGGPGIEVVTFQWNRLEYFLINSKEAQREINISKIRETEATHRTGAQVIDLLKEYVS